jgi:2-iminoacetate synthase ThiH
VQEVIVQNFLPKTSTRMRHAPAAASDEYRWTVAAARLILPDDVRRSRSSEGHNRSGKPSRNGWRLPPPPNFVADRST